MNTTENDVGASCAATCSAVLSEVEKATAKFPTWPTDPLHALAVLGEEFGELTKEMVQLTYEPHKTDKDTVRTEAIQTAAMALRLVMSLDRYEYTPRDQHSQLTPRMRHPRARYSWGNEITPDVEISKPNAKDQ